MKISKLWLQRLMLVFGVIALIVVLVDLGISIAATIPGSTPVRVEHVKAGPYQLTVGLYRYPASAGYALPFAIAPMNAISGSTTYQIFSVPAKGVDATPVRATFSPDPNVHNGIQGAAEITVKGPWSLQIQVNGAAGQGLAYVSFPATALPAVPVWLGWLVGLIPLYIIGVFLFMQMSRNTHELRNEV
jgi:hypothetical protein